jgi:energy-coupling factor transporter ATP-binding protein EcfA2
MSTRRSSSGSSPPRGEDPSGPLPELGRLHYYAIKGLFGRFDYHFDFHEHEPTLLTGVNGTGKSTILKTIDAVSANRWLALAKIPFDRLVLGFENRSIEVARRQPTPEIAVTVDGNHTWKFADPWHLLRTPRLRRILADRLGYFPEELQSMPPHTLVEMIKYLPPADYEELSLLLESVSNRPDWMESLRNKFPVLFVTDQRLVLDSPRYQGEPPGNRDKLSTKVAVEKAARDVAREIQRAKSGYATVSQNLDRDFPQRVVEAMHTQTSFDPRSLQSNLVKLAELRGRLEATRLLAVEEAAVSFAELELEDASVRAVMATYLDDTRRKLASLEPLSRRLQLFTAFLNQHYGTKSVLIDQEKGFRITVEGADEDLPPASLSSGERQILVLAHQILFRAQPATLVLIDEPELSLHVVWQATFVDDLARMGEVDQLSFLLATHSPTLIGGREDLKRSLDRMA